MHFLTVVVKVFDLPPAYGCTGRPEVITHENTCGLKNSYRACKVLALRNLLADRDVISARWFASIRIGAVNCSRWPCLSFYPRFHRLQCVWHVYPKLRRRSPLVSNVKSDLPYFGGNSALAVSLCGFIGPSDEFAEFWWCPSIDLLLITNKVFCMYVCMYVCINQFI